MSSVLSDFTPVFGPIDCACPQPALCPLNRVKAGTAVRIKQLSASPDICHRLREMGLGEEQRIKLIGHQSNVICQVCNMRLGISSQLAGQIWVEPIAPRAVAA